MTPERKRVKEIKESLHGMSMEELEQMSSNLSNLLQVLITRQVAVEDEILERLEASFVK